MKVLLVYLVVALSGLAVGVWLGLVIFVKLGAH